MPLAIPIEGGHITAALEHARELRDEFGAEERRWLDSERPDILAALDDARRLIKGDSGDEQADAIQSGALLSHHAVRLACADDEASYRRATARFYENSLLVEARIQRRSQLPGETWGDIGALAVLFGDEGIATALDDVQHPLARRGAGFMLALFALDPIPDSVVRAPETA